MSYFIDVFVIVALFFAIFLGWNDRLHVCRKGRAYDFVRVVSPVAEKVFSCNSVNQGAGFRAISCGTCCNNRSDRHTMRIHGQVYLGVEPLLFDSSLGCRLRLHRHEDEPYNEWHL